MYFDAAVVFVTSQTLLLKLALAILCSNRCQYNLINYLISVTDVSFSKENCSTMGWETHPEQTDNNTSRVLKQVQITRETDREKCEILVKATKKLHSVTPYLNWKLDRSWECAMHPNFLCEEELGAPIVCAEFGSNR